LLVKQQISDFCLSKSSEYDFLHIKKALLSLRSRQKGEIAMRMKKIVENRTLKAAAAEFFAFKRAQKIRERTLHD